MGASRQTNARLFLVHPPPLLTDRVPAEARHRAAPNGRSVLLHGVADLPVVDFETLAWAVIPLPLARDRAATTHTANSASRDDLD